MTLGKKPPLATFYGVTLNLPTMRTFSSQAHFTPAIKLATQELLFLIRTSDKKKNCSEIVTLTPNLFENGKIKRCISCLFRCE